MQRCSKIKGSGLFVYTIDIYLSKPKINKKLLVEFLAYTWFKDNALMATEIIVKVAVKSEEGDFLSTVKTYSYIHLSKAKINLKNLVKFLAHTWFKENAFATEIIIVQNCSTIEGYQFVAYRMDIQ